ncbi:MULTISPECIES: gamma-butyrobetaine hydroxylase-like domain-containing protein [Candidatus Ichthyocystis]|uniref:gamma-butyrobetaine hydroxylase-like domain-containing protein n=1 Tax=Candidatus Ichthyocystis TaxID=2929841 RepID=UPI000B896E41|nr:MULTISPECIES: gamma-butyrobetaine hydroxylase-like domain-containing protein [Ichthyocystis]
MTHHTEPPEKISIDPNKKEIELSYTNNTYHLSFEFLRTHAPSAEIRNPITGKFNFIPNKKNVQVTSVELVGNYAIRIIFSDGYHNGIFSWEYIQWLITNRDDLWKDYQEKLGSVPNKNPQ